MSKKSKINQIAACVAGALALATSCLVQADPLLDVQNEAMKTHKEAARSQEKINSLYEQSQELLVEYRSVVDQTENLKIYNDYLAGIVADQQVRIDDLQAQIDSIEDTKQNIVPLMRNMITYLEAFIKLDIPIKLEERLSRVERLNQLMGNSNVAVAEQFRNILDAYSIENDYGRKILSYKGDIELKDGTSVAVEFFNLGRVSLVALSLDQESAWVWDNDSRSWEELGSEYIDSVVTAVKMANNLVPNDLVKLPIKAVE